MRRSTVLMIVVAVSCAGMFLVSFAVPSYAVRAIESGKELSLPEQICIAAGNFWGRYGIFVTIALFVAAGVFSRATRLARAGAAG
jgi:type II secretory pathway component PulF